MDRQLIRVPFHYSATFVPKGKRKEQNCAVLDGIDVVIERLAAAEAPPVVAVWTPAADESDGCPVEIRRDRYGFFVPVFPQGYEPARQARFTAAEMLAFFANPSLLSKADFPSHPLTGNDLPMRPAQRYEDLVPHRRVSDSRNAEAAYIVRRAANYFMVGNQIFVRSAEPVLNVGLRRVRLNGLQTGRSRVAVTVDLAPWTNHMAGIDTFRLTSLSRAMTRAEELAVRTRNPAPIMPELTVVRPGVFTMDDESPVAGWDLIEALRMLVHTAPPRSEPRVKQIADIVATRDREFRERHIAWNDPGLPQAAALLRQLLDEGLLVGNAHGERLMQVLQRWEARPFEVAAESIIGTTGRDEPMLLDPSDASALDQAVTV